MNLENTLIMKLTESGLCLWKRFDGSYFEQTMNQQGIMHEVYRPERIEAKKEEKVMKISDCM